jgi:hypothetical protein
MNSEIGAVGVRTIATAAMLIASVGLALAETPAQTKKKVKAPATKQTSAPKAVVSQTDTAKAAPASDEDPDALRHAAQNPVASMISVPFQNNVNFGTGPYSKPQNVLNIQPVIPLKISDDWNLITRWVTPVISQPQLTPTGEREFGLGNIQPSFFLSPSKSSDIIWGVGTVLWLPTASDRTLGVNKWGGGPSAVALTIKGPWVLGALVNNIWAGSGTERVNQMLIQPFINYNLPGGWYLTTSPLITANWLAQSGDKWTVPVGGGFGRLFKVESIPVNFQVQAFYNVVKPTFGPDWTGRVQLQFLFPTK